jgi:hypothetical protein
MRELGALVLSAVVFALSALHFQWSRGSHWPEASEEALARAIVGDGRRHMPSPIACLAVSAVLALVALWPLCVATGVTDLRVPQTSVAIGGVFVGRGLAGYVPRWRQLFSDEPFATRDKRYYSPLCLVLGLGYAALGAGDFAT